MQKKTNITLHMILYHVALLIIGLGCLLMVTYISYTTYIKPQPLSGGNYCNDNGKSVPYCQYVGQLNAFYVNKDGLILYTLDTPFTEEQLAQIGYEIDAEKRDKVTISLVDNVMTDIYTTALTQARLKGGSVKLHLRGIEDGYLVVDRIWL